jgi:hypothetical protein
MYLIGAIVLGTFIIGKCTSRTPKVENYDNFDENVEESIDYDDMTPEFPRHENQRLIEMNILEYKNDPHSFDPYWGQIYETYNFPALANQTQYRKW